MSCDGEIPGPNAPPSDETIDLPASTASLPEASSLSPAHDPHCLGRLGNYEIVKEIGRGAMGVVFKARDSKLGRFVAIKVLSGELAFSGAAKKRFFEEARAAAAVTHEHVVTIHAVQEANGTPFLVMEYIVGVSLQDRLRRTGPLKVEEILRIGMQAAAGLAAAHAQGLIHRDIKPANILLDDGVERVKITDFGLARVVHEAQATQTNVVAGTPQYMSPEQAEGKRLDHRSDLFSLGCVLYAMCTGRSPFRADSALAAMHRVCEDTPRPIPDVNPEIPEWLVAVIDRLLAKKREDRIQSASELTSLLANGLAHVQQPALNPLPSLPRPVVTPAPKPSADTERTPARMSRRWLAILATAAGLMLAAVASRMDWSRLSLWPAPKLAAIAPPPPGAMGNQSGEKESILAPSGSRRDPPKKSDPPRTGLLRVDLYPYTGPVAIEGCEPLKAESDRKTHEVLVPAGRREVKIYDGATLLRSGTVDVTPGSTTDISTAYTFLNLYPFPPQPGPLAELRAENERVWRVALSPDRETLAAGFGGGTVVLWRLRGATWEKGPTLKAHRLRVSGLAFSPEGDRLATGSPDGNIGLWDVATGQCIETLNTDQGGVHALAFAPDGRTLAAGNGAGSVDLWDVESRSSTTLHLHAHEVHDLAFSPDGSLLAAAAGQENFVKLWDVRAGKERHVLRGHSSVVMSVAFSPDGKTLASASDDGTVRLWDSETGSLRKSLVYPCGGVASVAFDPDGRRIAGGGNYFQSVRVWDAASGSVLQDFHAHWSEIRGTAFLRDGTGLVTGSWDNTIRVWSLAPASPSGQLASAGPWPRTTFTLTSRWIHSVAVAPQRRLLAVAISWGRAVVWDLDKLQKVAEFDTEGWMNAGTLAFTGDEKSLVLCPNGSSLWLWDAQTCPCQAVPMKLAKGPGTAGIAVSPVDQTLALTQSDQGTIRLFDLKTNGVVWPWDLMAGEKPFPPVFSADGRMLAVPTTAGRICLLSPVSGKPQSEPLQHGDAPVSAVAFSPKDGTLASGGDDRVIKLWSTESLKEIAPLEGHKEKVHSAAFSPEGDLLVTAGGAKPEEEAPWEHEGEICVWSVATKKLLRRFTAHCGGTACVQFTADGKSLVTAGRDGRVHLWDVEELRKPNAVAAQASSHENELP